MPPPLKPQFLMTGLAFSVGLSLSGSCQAQSIEVPNGLPEVPHVVYPEVGLPNFTVPAGTVQQIGGDGKVIQTTQPVSTGSDSLQTLYSRAWGYQAADNASSIGVNPAALAATCQVESGCQNVYTATGSGHTITGAFQMSNGTYSEEMSKALAANPGLASTITSGTAGQQDPATQAVAAAQYLKDAALSLQKAGVSNPTAVDTRGYYNFGPTTGNALAQAGSSDLMSDYISSSKMSSNGVTSGMTVGQWRQSVADKMGTGATSPVLSS